MDFILLEYKLIRNHSQKMDAIFTSNCLCCGAASNYYLEHLLELHKFSLAKARELIRTSYKEGNTDSKGTKKQTETSATSGENIRMLRGIGASTKPIKSAGQMTATSSLAAPVKSIIDPLPDFTVGEAGFEIPNESVDEYQVMTRNLSSDTNTHLSMAAPPISHTKNDEINQMKNKINNNIKERIRKKTWPRKATNLNFNEDMFKYDKLTELVKCSQVHKCMICGDQFPNDLLGIHKHVMNRHEINVIQYHALYFKTSSWNNVGTKRDEANLIYSEVRR